MQVRLVMPDHYYGFVQLGPFYRDVNPSNFAIERARGGLYPLSRWLLVASAGTIGGREGHVQAVPLLFDSDMDMMRDLQSMVVREDVKG